MRLKIVAGNWKMNGNSSFAGSYLGTLKTALAAADIAVGVKVVLAPPSTLLSGMNLGVAGSVIELAGQNVSSYQEGAYTGELSAAMLTDVGCLWCLVGHSERRALFGESNQDTVEKVKRLLEQRIRPILCVGETLAQRESGAAEAVVAEQLDAVFGVLDEGQLSQLVVAYEPVWAIGTGHTATPDQAQEMHKAIRGRIVRKSAKLADNLTILYGGSVNAANAQELFAQPDIDGGLVGGASLKAKEFSQICEQMG